MNNNNLTDWIFKITVSTLSMVVLSVIFILLYGLFDDKIDNNKVFDIIGPAFSTVIGAFVGLLGGLSLNKNSSSSSDCSSKKSK